MREVGHTSTKLHFANSWVHKSLKCTPLSVYVRDAFRISTWSLSRGFVFKCATHGIRCSSAGGYQTALHCCGAPFWIGGWIACIRRKASCTELRCTYRDGTNTCIVPPLIYSNFFFFFVPHDTIWYQFSYPAIQYLLTPQIILIQLRYNSFQEYIDRYYVPILHNQLNFYKQKNRLFINNKEKIKIKIK